MTHYIFDCGCKIPVLNEQPKSSDDLPSLEIPFEEISVGLNYGKSCPSTWELLDSGNTKGVFQLETNLGQSWSKRLKPTSMEEMAALISLIRPGCLQSKIDGKSMTQHYIDRKFGIEESVCPFKPIAHILEPTYNVMTFQEQAMRIAVDGAGFNEQQADILRKAIGKKPEIMAKVKTEFLEGCDKVGLLSKEESEEVFGWIEKSQRYSFNKSHAVAYGMMGYLSAYAKQHFPYHFYCSYVKYAREKQDTHAEIKQLVADAKLFNVKIAPPSIETLFNNNSDVCINKKKVHFGIRSVKKIGAAAIAKLLDKIKTLEKKLHKPISNFTWLELLLNLLPVINTTSVNGLISIGVFDKTRLSRNRMLYEYQSVKKLTDKERQNLITLSYKHDNLIDLLLEMISLPKKEGGPSTKNRVAKIYDIIKLLKETPYSTSDSPSWILTQEKELLGIGLSYDAMDTISNKNIAPNTTCKEFINGKGHENITLGVELTRVTPYKIKKKGNNEGKEMGFITVEDKTCAMDCVVFTNQWEKYRHLLFDGSVVFLQGKRSDKDSFIVDKVFAI